MLLDRRQFITATMGALTVLSTTKAVAYQREVFGPSGRAVEVGVSLGRWSAIYASQRRTQWCWAASLQMLFASAGHAVEQEDIVRMAYGRKVNLPSFTAQHIAALSNRDWIDGDGVGFSSRLVAAYDFFAGIKTLDDAQVIDALADEKPMIICNRSHAMLLTAATYVPTPAGPRILNMGVFDPWPGRGARGPDRFGEFLAAHMGGELTYLGLAEIH